MVKVIIAAHGNLAQELLNSASAIAGIADNIHAVNMTANDSLEQMQKNLSAFFDSPNDIDGTLILVDMIGGTPCNACAPICQNFNTQIVAGVNLPMVLSAMFNSKTMNTSDLADKVCADGVKSIKILKKLLNR
ncbi:MAG: PTS sugar transporter subunit IIA [Elusimicrobiota bacterium]|jgi:PTS system mannose-specific IIA component|nr:PTS sugar transporter subunit IIA [Elusimicrobiota bacterium]